MYVCIVNIIFNLVTLNIYHVTIGRLVKAT